MLSNKRALVLLDLFREPLSDAAAVVLSSRPLCCVAGVFSLLRCCWAGHSVVALNDQVTALLSAAALSGQDAFGPPSITFPSEKRIFESVSNPGRY